MKNVFNIEKRHRITEANINFYSNPFVHPSRKMDEHDFIYLLQGEWKIGQNEEIFSLEKDTLLILGAGMHHFGAAPCVPGTKTMYFHVAPETKDQTADEASKTAVLPSLIHAAENPHIKKYFSETVNAKLSGDDRRASLFFDLLLCELSMGRSKSDDGHIGEKIRKMIHQNPETFLSNAEIAARLGVSVKTAENKFKNRYGVTIHRYTLDFKIEQAVSYLHTFPEMQIKEIAYNLGFYDEYHFSKRFKKTVGLSPDAYRRRLAEKKD